MVVNKKLIKELGVDLQARIQTNKGEGNYSSYGMTMGDLYDNARGYWVNAKPKYIPDEEKRKTSRARLVEIYMDSSNHWGIRKQASGELKRNGCESLVRLLEQAVNPSQYDGINWADKETADSPSRRFFYHYIEKYQGLWEDSDVLDVGCGNGWLLGLMQGKARSVEGFDPSGKNVEFAKRNFPKRNFPDVKVSKKRVETFNPKKSYDYIISVMAFHHLKEVRAGFAKVAQWLSPAGELQIIVPDYEHYKEPRPDQESEIEDMNDDEYVIRVVREEGPIVDIVRRTRVYGAAANCAGLDFLEDVPMYPTQELMDYKASFIAQKDDALTHLLRFEKK